MTISSGAPPGDERGPGGVTPYQGRSNAPVATTATTNTYSVQARADETPFCEGYRLGYPTGWQGGYQYAHYEIAERDRLRMARMHGISTTPAYRDLERVRWDGRREDFANPRPGDFRGFGADYEPPTTGDHVREQREVA